MPWNENKGGGGGWTPGGGGRGPWGQGPSNGGGRGQGPNIRPPDLDEVFKRGREWLRRMFPNQPPGTVMATLIGGAALVLWLWTGVYVIQQQELGVVTRFGKYVEPPLQPGFHLRFPQPIESVVRQHVQQRETNVGFERGDPSNAEAQPINRPHESLMLTGDENIIDIDFTVFWMVRDAADFTFNVLEPEETVKAVAEAAMREVIGQTRFDDAVQAGRAGVEERVKGIMQATLDDYRAGVTITKINIGKASNPEQVLAAFRDVQAAEQDLNRKVNQARQYENTVLPRARGEAAKILQDAEAYKQQNIAEAKGEAQRFIAILQQYQGAKQVTRERMFLETMQKVLGSANKVIVPAGGSAPVLPYVPLPDLRRSQPPQTSSGGTSTGAAP
jgi:membrane protease subunit HflK